MIRRVAALLAPVAVAVASAHAQQPSFATRVDTVRVDVEVRRDNRPVEGLGAGDFEVLDNGVPQTIDLIAASAAPIDVVLVLDTSASLGRRERADLAAAGTAVVGALRPGERSAFLTFADRVAIHSLFSAEHEALRYLIEAPMPGGATALNDAAHAAMLVGSASPGRPIVVLFSDGEDTTSFLDDAAVLDTARRTGAVVCAVTLGRTGGVLPSLAELTGGIFLKETSLNRVTKRFTEILERFRHRYLISFTPTGVSGDGWHALAVRVKGGGQVRARTGYWGGEDPAAQ